MIGAILTTPVKHGTRIQENRTLRHLRLADFHAAHLSIIRPIDASGHDLGSTVLFGEVRECPDRIELRLDPFQMGTPGPSVTMDRLRGLTRANADDLREMQLNPLTPRRQKLFRRGTHRWVHDEFATGRRARNQRTRSSSVATGEIVCAAAEDPAQQDGDAQARQSSASAQSSHAFLSPLPGSCRVRFLATRKHRGIGKDPPLRVRFRS